MPWITRRRLLFIFIAILISLICYWIFFSRIDPYYDIGDPRTREILNAAEKYSLCSSRSARRGYNQHVLSVAAYESTDRIQLKTNLTWLYIKIFANQAKLLYPNWVVRVYYYDLFNKSKADIDELEKSYPNLDFCNGEDLPVLGNLKNKLPGKIHRFLPAIDPLVGVTMVRDLDSDLFEREVNAVNQWLFETSYAFHMMRDHPMHSIPMLGGLWGVASNRLSISDRFEIARALLQSTNEYTQKNFWKTYSGSGDQLFLEHHVWPLARRNSIAHDSFTCIKSRYIYRADTRPFPSQRQHPACFVGCAKPCCSEEQRAIKDFSSIDQCPPTCRPPEHQDWLFC